jgi:cysteinyl-tRNA synthetase
VIPDLGAPDEGAVQAAFSVKRTFLEAMDDDINTRIAVSQLFRLDESVRSLRALGKLGRAESYLLLSVLEELSGIVGLAYPPREKVDIGSDLAGSLVDLLIDLRADARKRKDYATADRIRKELSGLGVELEDEGGRTVWKLTKRQ